MSSLSLRYVVLGVVLALASGLSLPVLAQSSAVEASLEATEMLAPDSFVTELLAELKDISVQSDSEERESELRDVLLNSLAVQYMQRKLISGEIVRSASEEQKAEYDELFPSYIAAAIGDSIDRMVDRRIDVGEVVERRPGDYTVPAKIFSDSGEERALLVWRIRSVDGKLVVVDFAIEGQTFIAERKAQFTGLVKKRGFGSLLEHMHDVVDN